MSINISVELTPAQVQKAISDYLANEGLTVDSVSFSVSSVSSGYGRDEYDTYQFSGATAKVTLKSSHKGSKAVNSLAAQISAVENDPRQYGDR